MQSPYVHPYFTTELCMLIVQESAWDLRRIFPVTRRFVQTPRELWFRGQAEPGRVPSHNQEEGNSTSTAVRIVVPIS
jgi:hypothetical protein